MNQITVVALIGRHRLEVGRYDTPEDAELVGRSWARFAPCRGVVITAPTLPPLVLIHPSPSTVTPAR